MKKRLPFSIRTNFLILTTFIVLLNSFIITSYYLYYEKNHRYRDLAFRARALVNDLAKSSIYGLITEDSHLLAGLLQGIRERDLAFAFVANESGRILAQRGQVPRELVLPPSDLKDLTSRLWAKGPRKTMVVYAPTRAPLGQGDESDLLGPQATKLAMIGYVAVGLSYQRIEADLAHIRKMACLLSLSVNLVAILVAYFLSHYLSAPLKKLTLAARSISRGVNPGPLRIKGRGEIGELTRAFNTMLAELQRSHRQLEDYTRGLEEMVKERTLALEQSVQELQHAYEELKRIHDIKAQFIQTASHELRTPLTAIKANVDFILHYESELLTEDHREILEAIQRNVNQMHKMVENMLSLVRLEEGLELDQEEVDLASAIDDCLLELSSLKGKRAVQTKIPAGLKVYADPDRLHVVFINLLSNAFRFTDDRGEVIIKAEKRTGHVRIEVQDNGVGIPVEHIEHIFEPFYQADRSRGGTGLGLAIVKRIVEGHGGEVTVSSSEEGTTFVILWPDGSVGEEESR